MAALALVAITMAAAVQLVWGGTVIGQDSATQFYPWYDYLGERLLDGEIPGWNPYQFGGVPFAADPQSGWMYLPAMLIFTLLPLGSAIPLFIVFHLVMAGGGTYVLSRLLGVGPGSALVAAVAYELTPPIYGRSVCCPAQYEIGAWMPVALVGAELAVRNRVWSWRIIGWAIAGLAVSQALGAWLGQGGYYFLLFLASYLGYRTLIAPTDRDTGWSRRVLDSLLHGASVFSIGFGLAAAGILPRLEYIGRSNVAGGQYGEDNAWAAQIGGVTPSMIFDRMLDPTLYYPGVAVLVLAGMALFLARGKYGVPFFAVLGICAVILATPVDTPLHLLFYAMLPKFEELHRHWPDRVAVVGYLAFAMLVGAAVESLRSRRPDARLVLVASSVLLLALLVLIVANADIPKVPVIALFLTLGVIAAVFLPQGRWVQRMLPSMLVTIVAIDLLVAFDGVLALGPYGGFHRVDIDEYYAQHGAASFLQERAMEGPGRYIGFDPVHRAVADGQLVLYRYQFASPATTALLVNNRGVMHGIEDAQGYNPVQPSRFVDYLTALNGRPQEYHDANVYPSGLESPLLDLLNVRYMVIPSRYADDRSDLRELEQAFPTIYADEQVQVLENHDALPRAWIVHHAQHVDHDDVLDLLASGAVDPRTTALLETTPPEMGMPSTDSISRVTSIDESPEHIRLETQAGAPGLLVLSETFDPGWRAYVDGKEVDILAANYLFRAVPIPAGDHTVVLRYESLPLHQGLAISGFTAAVLLPALIWAVRKCAREGRASIGRD